MHSVERIAREIIVKTHHHAEPFINWSRVIVQTMQGMLIHRGNDGIWVIPPAGLAERLLVLARGRIVGTGLVLRQPASRIVRWSARRVGIPHGCGPWW
jgi:hypothetical protein